MKFSTEERLQLITLLYKSGGNASETQRRYAANFHQNVSVKTILKFRALFEDAKSLHNRKSTMQRKRKRHRIDYFRLNPMKSVSDAVRYLRYGPRRRRVSFETVHTTLRYFKYVPYHILPVQNLTLEQKELQFRFVSQTILIYLRNFFGQKKPPLPHPGFSTDITRIIGQHKVPGNFKTLNIKEELLFRSGVTQ